MVGTFSFPYPKKRSRVEAAPANGGNASEELLSPTKFWMLLPLPVTKKLNIELALGLGTAIEGAGASFRGLHAW